MPSPNRCSIADFRKPPGDASDIAKYKVPEILRFINDSGCVLDRPTLFVLFYLHSLWSHKESSPQLVACVQCVVELTTGISIYFSYGVLVDVDRSLVTRLNRLSNFTRRE